MQSTRARYRALLTTGVALVLVVPARSRAGEPARPASETVNPLSASESRVVDACVDRALAWIASRQQPDGSFPTLENGQPAVTALCVMAFLSRGHLPGKGPYGRHLDKAVAYILASQAEDGIIARVRPPASGDILKAQTVAYNHVISGLVLSELYGQTSGALNERIHKTLESAIRVTLQRRPAPKRNPADQGGWRYDARHQSSDSDLSVTSWALMFLRSCRNAGFDVPAQPIDEALQYVARCYDPQRRIFWYALRGQEHVTTRAMTGAGVLALSLAGRHQTPEGLQAGDWLLEHPFDQYMGRVGPHDRFFYGAFYCSQAMFQLGGRHWQAFFPVMSRTLVQGQAPDGSWRPEDGTDRLFGNVYSSAMAVLALSPPYQLLPIFQR